MKRWTGILVLLVLTASLAPAQSPAKPMNEDDCPMMMTPADMDKKLQSLLDDMNKAQGQAKIDKMAAVINELVAQRASCSMMKKGSAAATPECH